MTPAEVVTAGWLLMNAQATTMTSAESRTLREALGLTIADVADLSGTTPQTVRRCESGKLRSQGRVTVHPGIATVLTNATGVAARAAVDVAPVLYRDQDEYDQAGAPLGDYRIHNAAVLASDVDAAVPSSVRWVTRAAGAQDATLWVLRRRAGVDLDWLAAQMEIHVNKLRRLETGIEAATAPSTADQVRQVRTFLAVLLADMATYTSRLLRDAAALPADQSVVFVRVHADTASPAVDDTHLELPATSHALATWAAVQQLRDQGRATSMIWLDNDQYDPWRGGRPDTRAARTLWATQHHTASNT